MILDTYIIDRSISQLIKFKINQTLLTLSPTGPGTPEAPVFPGAPISPGLPVAPSIPGAPSGP